MYIHKNTRKERNLPISSKKRNKENQTKTLLRELETELQGCICHNRGYRLLYMQPTQSQETAGFFFVCVLVLCFLFLPNIQLLACISGWAPLPSEPSEAGAFKLNTLLASGSICPIFTV